MKFEYTEVFNIEGAFRGMRNPKESWDKSDSIFRYVVAKDTKGRRYYPDAVDVEIVNCCNLGVNDIKLAQSLIRAGSEHRKFMRQIFVCVDITAPLYWWKEFDTYKVGTVANSTSTMHKLASTPIDFKCFEFDDTTKNYLGYIADNKYTVSDFWISVIKGCESLRQKYNETKDKRYWKELIRLLPDSWLQRRTVTMNYENLLVMCSKGQRRNHKLTEWSKSFIDWARSLPYAQQLIFIDEVEEKKMFNLNELCVMAYENAAKREAKDGKVSTDTMQMLKHTATEVVEATEAYIDYGYINKTQSKRVFASELADIVCCVLIIAGKENIDMEYALTACMEKNYMRAIGEGDK